MQLYREKLNALCNWTLEHPDTPDAAVIRQVVADLDGDGPIGGMLHTLDHDLFTKVISMLIGFRRSAFTGPYQEVHAAAREALGVPINRASSGTADVE